MSKSFLEILNSPGQELNKFELFIQTFFSSIILSLFFLFISLLISSNDNFWIVFLSLELIIVFYCVLVLLKGFLEKHFDIYDKDDFKSNSYEGWIIGLCILNIGIFLSFFGIGYAFNVLFLGFSLGMIFVFPPYFMLLRRKIFNESNNLTCKENIGFNPKFYWILGIFCGFFTLVNSFWYLQSFYTLNYPSFFVCLCFIIFSFIWVAFVLSPDIWNKFLPIEIRSTNGFLIYSIIMIILSFLASNLFNALA